MESRSNGAKKRNVKTNKEREEREGQATLHEIVLFHVFGFDMDCIHFRVGTIAFTHEPQKHTHTQREREKDSLIRSLGTEHVTAAAYII